MTVKVRTQKIRNVHDKDQLYLIVETDKGKTIINIGKQNYDKLEEILNDSPVIDKNQQSLPLGNNTTVKK